MHLRQRERLQRAGHVIFEDGADGDRFVRDVAQVHDRIHAAVGRQPYAHVGYVRANGHADGMKSLSQPLHIHREPVGIVHP